MDDQATKENPPPDFNKIDLTQLQSFSFGTQWTQDKAPAPGGARPAREPRRDDRPPRPREGGGGDRPGEPRRDRREFRRPAGPAGEAVPAPGARPAGAHPPRGPRGDDREGGYRGPRREEGESRGGPRRESEPDRGPYISPFFNVTFYPEETSFATLVKTLRTSCRTVELFDIARAVVGKSDRCIAVVQRPPAEAGPAAGAAAPVKAAPLAFSVPDGLPFESEEAAVAHVFAHHLDKFFDVTEVEVEPPKGNFQVVNKCGVTGALLGPPNYHRYPQIMQQHHAAKVRLPFEVFRGRIESVRDPEMINQWLAQMKKAVRYVWKQTTEGAVAPAFDSLEEARQHLLTHARDQVVRLVEHVRFPGKMLETLPTGEIRRATEGALERQRRFPLETANALRGRLRREGFSIFKKGSKGISYVCSVRRKFRAPGQVFSDSIGALMTFVTEHPMIRRSELPGKFLGLKLPAAAPIEPAAAAPAGEAVAPAEGDAAPATPPAAPPAPHLSAEDHERFAKMHGDLRWLVSEGYVMEFMDGRLFAPPPMAEARKQEVEGSENDPENFPEAVHSPGGAPPPVPPKPEAAAPETVAAEAAVEAPVEPEPAAASEPATAPATPAEPAVPEPPAVT
jgi:hypothetical protein